MVHVKICGLRSPADATACVDLGATSIGLNFVPSSPRVVDIPTALAISRAAHAANPKTVVVGVVADLSLEEMRALLLAAGLDCLQLHGNEPPAALLPLLPHAYKAVRIASAADVTHARAFPGDHILVDAKIEGILGGTGATFDWSLVESLARDRHLTLAGGLTPTNVAAAIEALHPYCVDVASGVEPEGRPGVKDLSKVRDFIAAARSSTSPSRDRSA
jgi:phosphoribosylanthranilate isomerase